MKILTAWFSVLVATSFLSLRAQEEAGEKTMLKRFQGALFEEEVNRDLEKAAAGYESVIEEFDNNRTVVATAVFRLAEVYREKDDNPRAIGLYRRLIRDFPEETPLVKLSEGYLRGLGAEVPKAGDLGVGNGVGMTGATPSLRAQEARALAHAKATAAESPDLLDHIGKDGNTLLTAAASQSFLTVAGYLVDQGVVIDAEIRQGSTALHLAAENGHLSMVKLLIERGAEVDRPNSLGRSPLHLAVARGHESTVEFLIDSGANVERMVSLFEGEEKRDFKIGIDVMWDGTLQRIGQQVTGNVLHLDVLNGGQMLEFLLKKEVAQVSGDLFSHTPLEVALRKWKWTEAKILIEAGADLNTQTADGMTPLMLAAMSNADEALGLVSLFLERGVDPNEEGSKGESALLFASSLSGGERAVERLLAAKANPNAITASAESPLVEAISRMNLESAKLLLKAGADPNVKSPSKVPALSVLMTQLHLKTIIPAKTESVLALAQQLVDAGADINAVDQSNETGIFLAKGKSAAAVVDFYLKNGVDLSIRSNKGNTAFEALSAIRGPGSDRVPREARLRVWRATEFPKLSDRENRIWIAASEKSKPSDAAGKLKIGEMYLVETVNRIAPVNSIRLVDLILSRSDLVAAKPSDIAVWRGMKKLVPENWDMQLRGGDILEMVTKLKKGEEGFQPPSPKITVSIGGAESKVYETKKIRDDELIDPTENGLFSIRKMGLLGNPELNLEESILIRDGKRFVVNLEEKSVYWREGDELTIPTQTDPEKVLAARSEGIFITRPEIGFIAKVQQKRTELPDLKNRYQLAGTILDFHIRGEQVLPHPDLDRVVIRRIGADGKDIRIPLKLSDISKEAPANGVRIAKYPDSGKTGGETTTDLKNALEAVSIINPESVRWAQSEEGHPRLVTVFGATRDPWPQESIRKQLDPLLESAKLNQLSYESIYVPFPPQFRLEWGDIIEIPATKGNAEQPWIGFEAAMWFKLKRWAQVDVEVEYITTGKWGNYTLVPPQPLFQKGEATWDRGYSENTVGVDWRGTGALFQAVGNEDLDWNHFLVKRKTPDSTVMIDNPTLQHWIQFISGDRVVLTPRVK